MERIKSNKKNPDAILTADWHLRETHPVCRLDNFCEEAQWRKVDYISNLQAKYNCPVIHAGDLFDYWKPSPDLLSKTIEHLPENFWTIYGNHDLPQHNMDLVKKCGVYTLVTGKHLNIIRIGGNWNTNPEMYSDFEPSKIKEKTFFVWHVYTYKTEAYPGCIADKGSKILRKYPQYDLIVTGDNHQPFTISQENRLLVNPGSIFRMTADQINHKPCVYLYYADTNTVEPHYIPIEDNVISREHIENKKERDERIEAFVSGLNKEWAKTLSFEENLKRFEQSNKVRQSVMDIVWRAVEI